MGSKHKEIAAGDEEGQWPFKKAKRKQLGKYRRGAAVKIGSANPCERCVWYIPQGEYFLLYLLLLLLLFNNFLFHSQSLAYAGCIALKQRCVPHINTNTPAMIFTYGGVLSAIEKALQELMEVY